jgi:hypothetical protein
MVYLVMFLKLKRIAGWKTSWEKSSSPLGEKWCASYYSTRVFDIFQSNQNLLVLVDVKVVFGECWCVEGLWKIFRFVSPKPEFDEFQSWETCHLIHYLKWFQNSIGIVRDESFHGKLVANGNQYRRYYVLLSQAQFCYARPNLKHLKVIYYFNSNL